MILVLKKISDILSGVPAVVTAGVFLLLKLVLQHIFRIDVPVYLDPVWVSVVITGIPLLYEAAGRLVHSTGISKISSELLVCIGMAACIAASFLPGHEELFEAGEIGFIMSLGEILEEKTAEHARAGLRIPDSVGPEQAPAARIADRAASLLVPLALLVALITFAVTRDIDKGVTILVVFCPCALVLATPTAVMAGIGQASGRGVIIKSGDVLEKMGKVDTVVFASPEMFHGGITGLPVEDREDGSSGLKSGAGTDGSFYTGYDYAGAKETCDIPFEIIKKLEPLNVRAVILTADKQKTADLCAGDEEITVSGTSLKSGDGQCPAGRSAGEREFIGGGAAFPENEKGRHSGGTCVKSGITEVRTGFSPEEKAAAVRKLMGEGSVVCVTGDSVNDAPALRAADVGVAAGGTENDTVLEAADVVITGDGASGIPYLKKLANATVRTIRTSITLSIVINALAIVFSFMGILNPTTGALWHNAGSILVVLLSATLYGRKIE